MTVTRSNSVFSFTDPGFITSLSNSVLFKLRRVLCFWENFNEQGNLVVSYCPQSDDMHWFSTAINLNDIRIKGWLFSLRIAGLRLVMYDKMLKLPSNRLKWHDSSVPTWNNLFCRHFWQWKINNMRRVNSFVLVCWLFVSILYPLVQFTLLRINWRIIKGAPNTFRILFSLYIHAHNWLRAPESFCGNTPLSWPTGVSNFIW